MIELKKIITHLEENTYNTIEKDLVKTNAENFLFLLRAYRKQKLQDDDIIRNLKLNKNSFYVLKSRLHDKIQNSLTTHINISKEDVLHQLQNISDLCYNTPREISNSLLKKLEKDLLHFDMHFELQLVYSALKKNHLHSEDYFHYSQLYNKQVALGFSQEKVDELLGEFCLILSQYNFSKTSNLFDKLIFLRNEIINHSKLNPSKTIIIIRNIVDIQLAIFSKHKLTDEISVIELLQATTNIIKALPETLQYKKWHIVIDYLFFEHYYKTGQLKLATDYYEKTNLNLPTLLLHTGLCCCNQFLISKICFLQELNRINDAASEEKYFSGHYDEADIYSKVIVSIYNTILSYYNKNTIESIDILNNLYEEHSFKDYFHIQLELKIVIVFFLIENKKTNEAITLLNNLKRKIKVHELEKEYSHVFQIISLLLLEKNNHADSEKKRNLCNLYIFQNTGQYKIAPYLNAMLKEKYS